MKDTRRPWLFAALFAAALELAPAPVTAGAVPLALAELPARTGAALKVSSSAFQPGGDIPFRNTQYQGNLFPGLAWTPAPGAKSYVLILQDANVIHDGAPLVHCLLFDIPGAAKGLAPGAAAAPPGARFGDNYLGGRPACAGPKTPPGPRHAYHFQVFALDVAPPVAAGASLDALTAAMKGHVLASGELVGMGRAPGVP